MPELGSFLDDRVKKFSVSRLERVGTSGYRAGSTGKAWDTCRPHANCPDMILAGWAVVQSCCSMVHGYPQGNIYDLAPFRNMSYVSIIHLVDCMIVTTLPFQSRRRREDLQVTEIVWNSDKEGLWWVLLHCPSILVAENGQDRISRYAAKHSKVVVPMAAGSS